MIQIRIAIVALGLSISTVLHGSTALRWYQLDLPRGLWLTLIVYAAGCAFAAQGLLWRRPWARCLALSIALAALMQISAMALLVLSGTFAIESGAEWTWGIVQWFTCLGLLLRLSGREMASRFEERPSSPWDLADKATRLLRTTLIAALASIPMLFSMASNAVYATRGHTLAVVAGISIVFSILLVFRGRTIGLAFMAISALLGVVATIMLLATLDTNPNFASQAIYSSRTIIAAVALLPGLLLGLGVFAAFTPRMISYMRNPH